MVHRVLLIIIMTQSVLCMEIQNIIKANPSLLSHNDICALKLVNHACCKSVEDTRELRKNYFNDHAHQSVPFYPKGLQKSQISWHKNGSACTFIIEENNKLAQLAAVYLHDKGTFRAVQTDLTHLPERIHRCEDENLHLPRFNAHGQPCFYVYQWCMHNENGDKWFPPTDCLRLIQYILCKDGSLLPVQCAVRLASDHLAQDYDCLLLLNFPKLLSACLESKEIKFQRKSSLKNIDGKCVYDIKGVTIPHDYQDFKQFPGLP